MIVTLLLPYVKIKKTDSSLFDAICYNECMINIIKTILLLGVLSVILIFIGGLVGGQNGIYLAFFFALVINFGMYFFSDKLALSMSGAKPLDEKQYPELVTIVSELAMKQNIPMPKLYITPEQQANAFATGRDPKHSSVAVTQGILQILSKDELRAVLAHELGHVKNRDILVATIAAVFASAISFLANMSLFSSFTNNDEDNQGSPFSGIFVAILVPIAASIVQMAISRQREYGADETGAKTIGTGKPLAAALLAIHDSTRRAPMQANPAYASLYIDNPLGGMCSSRAIINETAIQRDRLSDSREIPGGRGENGRLRRLTDGDNYRSMGRILSRVTRNTIVSPVSITHSKKEVSGARGHPNAEAVDGRRSE